MQHPEYASITCQKQFVIAVNVIKSLFYYTILTILALPVVCDVYFIVITGNILQSATTIPSLNQEYHYTEDRYTGVLLKIQSLYCVTD